MEYGAVVRNPCQKREIDQMESIQCKAVCFIARDYSSRTPGFVTGLLKKYNFPTLQERREDLRLTLLFKVIERMVPAIPPSEFLIPQTSGRKFAPRQDQTPKKTLYIGMLETMTVASLFPLTTLKN